MTYKTAPDHCPDCGREIKCATQVVGDKAPPKPGDLSICLYCRGVFRFTDELGLAAVALDELPVELRAKIQSIIGAAERVMRSRNYQRN